LNLDNMQQEVDTWIRDHGGYWDRFQILARLTEELGEVAGALQRDQGLRPRKTDVDLASEVGDVLFTLAAFANASNLRLSECIESVLHKYTARDSQAWKNNNQDRA
jgi:NTP pyrophosphatase (non-canonical NTP hydrolase)